MTWRSMETAPRDGTEVVLRVEKRAGIPGKCLVGHWMPGGHCIEDHPPIVEGWYFWNGRMFDRAALPVAWWPLPNPSAPEHAPRDEIRLDTNGELDEVVADRCSFHLERMDDGHWWMAIYLEDGSSIVVDLASNRPQSTAVHAMARRDR